MLASEPKSRFREALISEPRSLVLLATRGVLYLDSVSDSRMLVLLELLLSRWCGTVWPWVPLVLPFCITGSLLRQMEGTRPWSNVLRLLHVIRNQGISMVQLLEIHVCLRYKPPPVVRDPYHFHDLVNPNAQFIILLSRVRFDHFPISAHYVVMCAGATVHNWLKVSGRHPSCSAILILNKPPTCSVQWIVMTGYVSLE